MTESPAARSSKHETRIYLGIHQRNGHFGCLGWPSLDVYSEPSSSASESVGLHTVLDSQRQSISDKFYGDPIVQSGGQSDN